VNVILDVHLEHLVPIVFPLFASPLEAVRSLVAGKYQSDYEKQYKKAATLLEAADVALLFGRFCVDASQSFLPPYRFILSGRSKKEKERLTSLAKRADAVKNYPRAELPAFLEKLAADFPELCQSGLSFGLGNPLDALTSGGGGLTVILEALAGLKLDSSPASAEVIEKRLSGHNPPSAETLSLSRTLQRRWEVTRSSGVIMAPGRLNRLSAVRGDPMPFTLPASVSGKQAPQTKIVLVVDWSGSMSVNQNAPWNAALQAAQAIALAIGSTGDDVRAALFAEHLWHAPDYSSELLFSRSLGFISLSDANGEDTDFSWLPQVWQAFPRHRVLLLTDGNGYPPKAILPSGRKRTSAVLLQVRRNLPQNLEQIEATIASFASSFVHVDNLSELASTWALLIPRRMQ
jgi:hypothetical protein